MLKKMFTKKLILIMAVTFSLTLVCLIPNDSSKLNAKQELKYVDKEVAKSVAYLLDSNNYLARTMVVTSNAKIEEKARELRKF